MAVLRRQIRCWPDDDASDASASDAEPSVDPQDGPQSPSTPIERLVTFLEKNGYDQLTDLERDRLGTLADGLQRPPEDADMVLARGSTGAGWWSSDQSDLRSLVAVYLRDGEIEAQWAVDTTGQWLTDDDEHFWDRESDHAKRAAVGEISDLPDFRDREARRSDRISRNAVTTGIWAALLVFCLIVGLVIVGVI